MCRRRLEAGVFWACFIGVCSQETVMVNGVGASIPVDAYEAMQPAFQLSRRKFVSFDMKYYATGSGNAKKVIQSNSSSLYVGTDSNIPMTNMDDPCDLSKNSIIQFPIAVASVVLAYNVPDLNARLHLDADQIVAIFNGTVTHWNDSILRLHNDGANFPDEELQLVLRSDDSGSTEILTSALSVFSDKWRNTYGNFSELSKWPSNLKYLLGRTTRGMTGAIISYQFSIGYISIVEAIVVNTPYALFVNPINESIDVDPCLNRRILHDFDEKIECNLRANLADKVDNGVYPILGLTSFAINISARHDCKTMVELLRYISWLHRSSFAEELFVERGMTQLSEKYATAVENKVLKVMQCENGYNVWDMFEKQLAEELRSEQIWRLPVAIGVPIAIVLLTGLLAYIVVQKIKFRRAVEANDWRIDQQDVRLMWDRHRGRLNGGVGAASAFTFVSAMSGGQLSNNSEMSMGALWSNQILKVGIWNERKVCLRGIPKSNFAVTQRQSRIFCTQMKQNLIHAHVLRFFGFTEMDGRILAVSEHASKGALVDVLQNKKYNLDENFQFSMATDIAQGMAFLHKNGIVHSRLTSDCCLLDNKWNVKVSDWEFDRLIQLELSSKTKIYPEEEAGDNRMFWTAPELLQRPPVVADKRCDVYSFAILMVEIFTRDDPYTQRGFRLAQMVVENDYRPNIDQVTSTSACQLIRESWATDPGQRPTFSSILRSLSGARASKKSVVESMMEALEGYAMHLEEKVTERTEELATAKRSMENLLHQILPPSVAASLSLGQPVEPESFASVTIFFSDIVQFTSICARLRPLQVVSMLNDLYGTFDAVIDAFDVYKVETIGDSYMVISGCPHRNESRHVKQIADMSLSFVAAISKFKIDFLPGEQLKLRAGIHSGPVVAGVVGRKMPRYCLFGDTVNTASRMESTSLPMKIQLSQAAAGLLDQFDMFELQLRGEIQVKGKGIQKTYFLISNKVARASCDSGITIKSTDTSFSRVSPSPLPVTMPEVHS